MDGRTGRNPIHSLFFFRVQEDWAQRFWGRYQGEPATPGPICATGSPGAGERDIGIPEERT